MKIVVTQEHIDAGCRWRTGLCPVALAIKQHTACDAAIVSFMGIRAWMKGGLSYIVNKETPMEVRKFMADFDSGKPVEPMEFEL